MKNILLIVADSLRRDTFNQITALHGFTASVKRYSVTSMNSTTELSLPWMLTGTPDFSPTDNLSLDLKAKGYSTLLIHSNPIVDRFKAGFDSAIDLHRENRRAHLGRRYNRVRDALQKRLPSKTYHKVKRAVLGGVDGYLPYCRVEDKLAALERHLPGSPWFVWLHLMDPHTPYYPQGTGLDAEKIVDLNDNQISAVRGYYIPRVEEAKLWYSLYLEESAEMWTALNKYLETVDYTQTTVIFTSDHGEEFGEHGHYGHKGNRFNKENITVPFFIAGDALSFSIKDHSQLRELIKKLLFL